MNSKLHKAFYRAGKKEETIVFSCLKNILILFLILGSFSFYTHKSSSATCYDITTGHKCPQLTPTPNTNNDSFNNENLKRNYRVQETIGHLLQKASCSNNTATSSELNIIDIHQFIEETQLSEQEKFICKMSIEIRKKMLEILEDRKFMKDYIEKQRAKTAISKDDKIKMTALLIKYRLLANKNGVCSPYVGSAGECYFSSARFAIPKEMFVKINQSAVKYVNQVGEPKKCLFNKREYPLDSDQCEKEILSRVQTIPAPLILAQAAQESGWGNKKWASEYNNILGLQVKFSNPPTMSCYKNCRCAGKKKSRCALKFTDVAGCLHEYNMRFNASSNKLYPKFRKARENLKNMDRIGDLNSQCQNARTLVPYLKGYAEERKYVRFICNRLNDDICDILKKCLEYELTI